MKKYYIVYTSTQPITDEILNSNAIDFYFTYGVGISTGWKAESKEEALASWEQFCEENGNSIDKLFVTVREDEYMNSLPKNPFEKV